MAYQAVCRTEPGVVLISSWASIVTSEKRREESRRGAQDGQVRPLALRLSPHVFAHRMEGDFHRPSQDKPGQDLERRRLQIRRDAGPGSGICLVDRGSAPSGWVPEACRYATRPPSPRRSRRCDSARRTSAARESAVQRVVGSSRICSRVGSRLPTTRGRPFWRGLRGGAGVKSRASRRKRVTKVAMWRVASSTSMAAYSRSPTMTSRREGHQRWSKPIIWRAEAGHWLMLSSAHLGIALRWSKNR